MADTHTHESLQDLQGINCRLLKKCITYVTEPDTPGKKADQLVHLRDVLLHTNLLFTCKVLVTF